MTPRAGETARHYHMGTKHPNGRLMRRSHVYDPSRRPRLYKVYPDLEPIPLPLDTAAGTMPALEAIATSVAVEGAARVPDLATIARVLHFSAGITKRIYFSSIDEKLPFRAASCTGALYHIELYLVCGDLSDLDAGVYHFDVEKNALRRLRAGDYREVLDEASGNHPHVSTAPAIFIATDVYFRNAIKYQAREYRHAFWDSGTILANTLATATAHDLPATVVAGFVDDRVNALLDLNTEREFALELVPLGYVPDATPPPAPALHPLHLTTPPSSPRERTFPVILEIHEASALESPEAVADWRGGEAIVERSAPSGRHIELEPAGPEEMPDDAIEPVITRRGSTRQFAREPISAQQLATILDRSLRDVPADVPTLNDVYLIVNAVEGIDPGTYVYHREGHMLEQLGAGVVRDEAGRLALGQALAADAAVNVYFLTDLEAVLDRYGDRGYRAAQLDASIAAGRIYLAAYAYEIGATGLTFYDDAVTKFFSPHAEGKSAMFLMTVGMPAY